MFQVFGVFGPHCWRKVREGGEYAPNQLLAAIDRCRDGWLSSPIGDRVAHCVSLNEGFDPIYIVGHQALIDEVVEQVVNDYTNLNGNEYIHKAVQYRLIHEISCGLPKLPRLSDECWVGVDDGFDSLDYSKYEWRVK